jgi:acyl-coenzyme A thioesterase PaaI-like protein
VSEVSQKVRSWPPVETEPPTIHEYAPAAGEQLPPHFDECFACGPEQPGGLRIKTEVAENHVVRARFEVTKNHQGAPGLAHGGLLSCAFDEALGAVVGQMLRKPSVTGKLETDFRRPVPVGSVLHIAAKVDGVAGRKVYASAEGRLDAEDGPLAVEARALFITVGLEHFLQHGDVEGWRKIGEKMSKEERERWDVNP